MTYQEQIADAIEEQLVLFVKKGVNIKECEVNYMGDVFAPIEYFIHQTILPIIIDNNKITPEMKKSFEEIYGYHRK